MNPHELCLGHTQDHHLGRLDARQRRDWETHRDGCPACRSVIERWPHDAVVPDLRSAVLEALNLPPKPSFRPKKTGSAWLLPLASALTLALLITAFWRPQRQWAQEDRGYSDTCAIRVQGGRACCAN